MMCHMGYFRPYVPMAENQHILIVLLIALVPAVLSLLSFELFGGRSNLIILKGSDDIPSF